MLYNYLMRSLSIIYASTTGHTEFVVDTLIEALTALVKDLRIVKQRAEQTQPEHLAKADMLLLACGSWNTGNVEGQLSPFMYELVGKSDDIDLKDKPVAAIGLGDERYYYTAKAADRLTDFLKSRGAKLLVPGLKIINDPFDQTPKIQAWAKELAIAIRKLPTVALG